MIGISKPVVRETGVKSRLEAEVTVDGKKHLIWFEVDRKYGQYLCHERSDAFVLGLLDYAMRNGHDICCEAPIGEYLHYQLTTCLTDAVSKGSPRMHRTLIDAPVDSSELPCAGAAGTGISCGIDSLHVLAENEKQHGRLRLTHLTLHNVGSHGVGQRGRDLYAQRKKMAEDFCREYGFELVASDSNLDDEIPQEHFLTHTYTSAFTVFCLQKLFSVYYYASGRTFFSFSLADTLRDCSWYDLLLAEVFSTDRLTFYSEGGTLSRLEKTRTVAGYAPSFKYLNVCVHTIHNCSRCEKCTRTMMALDALGVLDQYTEVFDVEHYRTHRSAYLAVLCEQRIARNPNYTELYPFFKSQIRPVHRIAGWKGYALHWVKSPRRGGLFWGTLKKVYRKL